MAATGAVIKVVYGPDAAASHLFTQRAWKTTVRISRIDTTKHAWHQSSLVTRLRPIVRKGGDAKIAACKFLPTPTLSLDACYKDQDGSSLLILKDA